jgi:hypothetical protein
MGRKGPRGSCGKKALNCQILNVVNAQYVKIKHLQASLCPTAHGASAVAGRLHGSMSMSGIATPLKKGRLKPSGSNDRDRSDVQIMRGKPCLVASCLIFNLMIIKLLPMTLGQIIFVSLSY